VARWYDLRAQISAGVGMSMSGIPNWTHDIGGFAVEDRFSSQDPAHVAEWRELYLRWYQFGAFSPIFRSHGEFPYRESYNVAPEGSEVYESLLYYDRLRYRLMPYIYAVAADTYHRDGTMMRGLVMDFPNDPNVRDRGDEYMFGPAFLVAPVYEFRARTRELYLPAGTRWYDYNTGHAYDGGQTVRADAPLARMPLFVRAGSIVPTGPDVQHTGENLAGPLTIFVYTGANGAFDLYEDDGVSYGYQRGEFARIPLRYDEASGALTIGARSGSYPGMATTREIRVRWIGGPREAESPVVRYEGREIVLRRP
jgi:alpha-D-xyloside xylohydrolase